MPRQSRGIGRNAQRRTILIPGINFTCNGTIKITGWRVVGIGRSVQQPPRTEYPKLQIWQQDASDCETYHKSGQEITFNCRQSRGNILNSSRIQISANATVGVYDCKFANPYYASFQHGDILGLVLPPRNREGFALYFLSSLNTGPKNYITLGPSRSTIKLSNVHITIKLKPQFRLRFQLVSGRYILP